MAGVPRRGWSATTTSFRRTDFRARDTKNSRGLPSYSRENPSMLLDNDGLSSSSSAAGSFEEEEEEGDDGSTRRRRGTACAAVFITVVVVVVGMVEGRPMPAAVRVVVL